MPFTAAQFFGDFARCNDAIWPLQVVGHGISVAVVFLPWRDGPRVSTRKNAESWQR
jgi:hypothetical protein